MRFGLFVEETPTDVIQKIYRKISRCEKCVLISAFICGLLAHLYHFTNKQFNGDEIGFTPIGVGGGIGLGRWGLEFIEVVINKVFGTYSLPLFSGLISLLLVSLSAYFVIKIFHIKDCLMAVLIGALFATFPVLTSIYFFTFTAPPYAFALLLSIWSAYLFLNKRKTFINIFVAIIMLSFATGIYQAYFAVAVCTVLMKLILWCIQEKEITWGKLLHNAGLYLMYLVLSIILYFLIHKIVLLLTGITMISHRGLDQMGRHSIIEYLGTTLTCYRDWLSVMQWEYHDINSTFIVRYSIILLNIVGITYIVKEVFDRGRNILSKIMLVILSGIMPIAIFLSRVMAYPSDVYSLMLYSCIFILIFPIILCDNEMNNNCKSYWKIVMKGFFNWVVAISAGLCVLVYIWSANGSYMSLQYTNYRDLAYYETIITQIKELDGFNDELPLMLKGSVLNDESMFNDFQMDRQFILDGRTTTNVLSWNHENLISFYLGYAPKLIWDFQISEALDNVDEFEKYVSEMPNYPDDGAIQIVNGIIVVKFSD